MRICTVNGLDCPAPEALETWGQLLETLEAGEGPDREIVTAARFQGVDQPSFRDASVLAHPLLAAVPIDVETCRVRDLVASAVQTAIDGLAPLTVAARRTADAFRSHDLPTAHQGLSEFVATFHTLATLTVAVSRADAHDGARDIGSRDLLERLAGSLESLIEFNTSGDWISAADVLEYEIAEMLPRWTAVLRTADGAEAPSAMAHETQAGLQESAS